MFIRRKLIQRKENQYWMSTFVYEQKCYTPCLKKKLCQLIFCSLSVKYEPISQLEGVSRNKLLTKLCLKCPLHLKHVLALPWETWSARLSRQHNNEVHIWMINWIVTNITGSYCLLSLKKSHVSHHIIFIIACAQNVPSSTSAGA